MEYWMSKLNDKHPKLFIADSSNTHLDEQSIRLLRKKNVAVAVIPKGCTIYIQPLDIYVFSVFIIHYYKCAEEYIEKAGGRSKIKLTASQPRILCTRLTWAAWNRTLASIDFSKSFREIGYTWNDEVTLVKPHTLPGYIYDPTDRNLTDPIMDSDISIEEINDGNEMCINITNRMANKQLKLTDCWNKQ